MKLLWLTVPGMVLCMVPATRGIMHYFQLESYQFPGYFRSLRRNRIHAAFPGVAVLAVQLLMMALLIMPQAHNVLGLGNAIHAVAYLLGSAGFGYWFSKLFSVRTAKKKFVYTGRMKRLIAVYILVVTVLGWMLVKNTEYRLILLLPTLLPFVFALAGLLAWPIEKAISECYFRDAHRKLLSQADLLRIGITGSYGKTSVKMILATMLNEKYPTLATPASFNTPMGVTRTIREKLLSSHRIFIAEMGARHVGDIKELCRLVKPQMGILTSVGPQHLETFHSIERITSTKYELIAALPENGTAYFADDNAICKQLYDKTTIPKRICSLQDANADAYCDGVSHSADGLTFTLHIKGKGSIACQTVLLGKHALTNILLAAMVASDLGLSLRQIAHAISKIQPIANRLQLMHTQAGYTIINDAFNANPIGAKAALEVLKQFPGRKIIITPGMVELGADEAHYNRAFGGQIAESADIAIIVGKNRVLPILEGIREQGFPEENLYQVDSLNDSTALLNKIVHKDDIVLYENDLPDHYQEA